MLDLSGKSWARSAATWAVFVVVVSGLTEAGSTDISPASVRLHQAGAAKMSEALRRTLTESAQQVAKVEVHSFDLSALSPGDFGDADSR